jgi:hypothetical protein
MMNTVDDCAAQLAWLAATSLRFRPKTGDTVARGAQLASAFEQLTPEDRLKLIPLVTPEVGMKLMGLSGFMAEAAINTGEAALIRAALMLHVLEDFRKDYRENYRYLILIDYAARELGVDFKAVIESVMPLASVHARVRLTGFAARDAETNQLASFGLKGELVDGLFRFSPA